MPAPWDTVPEVRTGSNISDTLRTLSQRHLRVAEPPLFRLLRAYLPGQHGIPPAPRVWIAEEFVMDRLGLRPPGPVPVSAGFGSTVHGPRA